MGGLLKNRSSNCGAIFCDSPIWYPFVSQFNHEIPIKIIYGKGVYIFDEHNNKYLDSVSSWWVNIHGHANTKIAKAISRQSKILEQVLFANFTHQPAIDLANKVLNLLDNNFCKVFFSDNGSTSVEVAVKMAIQFWINSGIKKTKILALNCSYHGDTFGAMSVGGLGVFSEKFKDFLFSVDFIDLDDNCLEEVKKLDLNSYAFFIFEPLLQGAGGMNIYSHFVLDELLRKLKSYGVILIADEVMTAWGRTNKFFAIDYLTVKPDIICLSKGLTGGFLPLGLTVCNEFIHKAFAKQGSNFNFYHGHSFTANPISCSAALASIEILEQKKTIDDIEMISVENLDFVLQLKKNKNALNPRCLGTVVAFEIYSDASTYDQTISTSITKYFLQYQIFLRPLGNTIYIMPPFCIKKRELRYLYKKIINFLNNI